MTGKLGSRDLVRVTGGDRVSGVLLFISSTIVWNSWCVLMRCHRYIGTITDIRSSFERSKLYFWCCCLRKCLFLVSLGSERPFERIRPALMAYVKEDLLHGQEATNENLRVKFLIKLLVILSLRYSFYSLRAYLIVLFFLFNCEFYIYFQHYFCQIKSVILLPWFRSKRLVS